MSSPRTPISSHEVLRIVLVAAGTLALLFAIFRFRFLLLTASVGVLGGVLLLPLIEGVRRFARVPRGAAIGLVALTLLGLVGGGLYGLWTLIAGQARGLLERGPAIIDNFLASAQRIADRVPGPDFDLRSLDLAPALQRAGHALFKALHIGVEGLAGILVVAMIAIFVAANVEGYQRGVLSLLPPRGRPRAAEILQGCARVIRRWFTGQLLVMAITSAMTALALGGIGVDYWLVIALLTGLLDFIPFVGALLTGLLAVGVTLGTEPDKVLWVLLAYLAIQQIESDVVVPLVMKGRIQLPEAHLLVFVLLMGMSFGLLGVFAAPPLFGVLHHLYTELYVPWIERRDLAAPLATAGPDAASR